MKAQEPHHRERQVSRRDMLDRTSRHQRIGSRSTDQEKTTQECGPDSVDSSIVTVQGEMGGAGEPTQQEKWSGEEVMTSDWA